MTASSHGSRSQAVSPLRKVASLSGMALLTSTALLVSHAPIVNAAPLSPTVNPYAGVQPVEEAKPTARKAEQIDVRRPHAKPGEELPALRTAFTKTLAGDKPGQFVKKVSTGRLHVKQNGKFVDVDTKLAQQSDGSYAPGLTAAPVKIGGKANDANLVTVDLGDGKSIGWRLTGALAASANASANSAQYTNALPNATLQLTATPDGVKENIVLNSASAPNQFVFPLVLKGVTLKQDTAGIQILDSTGKLTGVIPAGYATDANRASTDKVAFALSGNTLTVTVDKAWLADPARKFPVAVDPTVTVSKDLADTLVREAEPATPMGSYSIMKVGLDNGTRARGYLRISLSELVGTSIEKADLKLYETYSRDCTTRNVYAYPITSSWSTSTTTWNNQPTVDTSYASGVAATNKGGGSGCTAGYISIPVTAKAREVVAGPDTNLGFSIRTDEANDMAYKEFNTVNAGVNPPSLEVTYTEPYLGQEKGYQFNTTQLTDQVTLNVNTASANLLLQQTDLGLAGINRMNATFAHWYNSRSDTVGMFGYGWTGTYGQDIKMIVDDSGAGMLVGPTGYRLELLDQGDGTLKPRPEQGVNVTVKRLAAGGYDAYFADSQQTWQFNTDGMLASIRNKTGQKLTMNYTARKLTSVTDTHGQNTTYSYDTADPRLVKTITAPDGRKVTFNYTGSDLTSVTDVAGKTTSYGYDTHHNLIKVTDPKGNATTITPDGERVGAITWADTTKTSYDWTAWPQVTMTDPNGTAWHWTVDDYGRMDSFTWPRDNFTETASYDANSSVAKFNSNVGGVGAAEYDGYNIQKFTDGDGVASSWTYGTGDNSDKPASFTNGNGIKTSYGWSTDGTGQMTSVSQDTGSGTAKTEINYIPAGQACAGAVSSYRDPKAVTAGGGATATFSYDTNCNLTQITRVAPLQPLKFTYDGSNRRKTATDGNGNIQTYTYNNKDQITQIAYSGPNGTSTVTMGYDDNGNRTSRSDAGKQTSWTLDARNRLKTESQPSGNTNRYDYDPNGNLKQLTEAGLTTSYSYDVENDVKSITPAGQQPVNYIYNGHTQVQINFPNNTSQIEGLAKSGRPTSIDYWTGGSHSKQFVYNYKNPTTGATTDQVYGIDDNITKLNISYGYDKAGRVTSSKGVKTADGTVFEDSSYTFDVNSNITSWKTLSGPHPGSYTATINAANQITGLTGPVSSSSFSYDGNGNLINDGLGTQFSYNERNQAVSIASRDSSLGAQTVTYDGVSQVDRTSLGNTKFINSALGIASRTDGAGATNYIKTPTGETIGQLGANGTAWFQSDRIGSVVGVTNTAAETKNNYWYDPTGKQSVGYQADASKGIPEIHHQFAGYYNDTTGTNMGFYKVGLRYLDTTLGRWTQTDPKSRITNPSQPAEASPYCYAGGNGCNQTDPTGAQSGVWNYECINAVLAKVAWEMGLMSLSAGVDLVFAALIELEMMSGGAATPVVLGLAVFIALNLVIRFDEDDAC